MNESVVRMAGRSAYANVILSLLNVVTILLYFTAGGFWGTLNDANSVFWILSFVPIALFFYQLHRSVNAPVSMVTTAIGIIAMVVFAFLQCLLVISLVRFEQTIGAILTLGGVLGLFSLVNGLLARAGRTLPVRLIWAMLIFGLSYLATAVGFWMGGMWHPLASAGFAVGTIAGLLWGFWLGRLLASGTMPQTATPVTEGSR